MKQKPTLHRRATGLLLAAVAFPLNPAFAQETVTAPPPVVDIAPPAPAPAPAPVITTTVPPLAVTPPPAAVPAPAPEPVAAETPRSTTRSPTARTSSAPPRRATPVTVRTAPAPAPAAAPATAPIAATPVTPDVTAQPEPAPIAEAPLAPVETTPAPVQAQPASGSIWPWLLGALVLIGAAAFLLRRRRRTDGVYEEVYADEREVVAPPVIGTQVADESYAAAPLAAPIAAAVETGRPQIALQMRPVRAGVTQEDAVVEFELTVDNHGNAPARDLRISTWMFPAGHGSEGERALIQPAQDSDLPAVTIDSGHAKRIESAVALPTAGLDEDAVLPVVVAEAHYRLPDGSEETISASFEVGVQIGDDLAHFDLDNPSGMHDDVVARPYREAIDA